MRSERWVVSTTPRTDAACGLPSNDWEATANRLFVCSATLECELTKAIADQRVLQDARAADFARICELENAIASFLGDYAAEQQPHGGIGEEPLSGDTVAFHARRILGRALK